MGAPEKYSIRNLAHARIENYIQQVIPTEFKLTEVFSNHPLSTDFEFHYGTFTKDGHSFRLIFSGFGMNIYLKFHFSKQITPCRILMLESSLKNFTDVTDFEFLIFITDVDMLMEDTKRLLKGKTK